jgi:hypothetical protein
MKIPRRCAAFCAAFLLLAGAPAARAADDFGATRMSAGIDAYRVRRYPEASDQFRIACFALLDQPALLVEGLARLALAQEAEGRRTDAERTLARFLDVERRFGTYAKSRLDASTRAEFENLLRARVATESLASVPSLAALARRPTARPGARKTP